MGQVKLNGAKSVTRVKNLNPFLMKLFLVPLVWLECLVLKCKNLKYLTLQKFHNKQIKVTKSCTVAYVTLNFKHNFLLLSCSKS